MRFFGTFEKPMRPLFPLLICLLIFAGCKKDPPGLVLPPPLPSGSVDIEFVNRVGTADLVFGENHLNAAGDSFRVSKFNYYVSNVVLVRENGSTFVHPESYFVVRHPKTRVFTIKNVPDGRYTALRFLVGVDSARNCSGAQTGGLDLSLNGDMFWSWNSGYIFMKLEGISPSVEAANKAFTFHIGGFRGADKTQRQVEIPLTASPLSISGSNTRIKLVADVGSVFSGPHSVTLKDFYYQMQPGPGARILADNYHDMFSLESVSN